MPISNKNKSDKKPKKKVKKVSSSITKKLKD